MKIDGAVKYFLHIHRNLYYALLFVGVSHITHGQVQEIEKLMYEKDPTEETVIWLCDTAYTFYGNKPGLTQAIGELALKKANEWDVEYGIGRAHHVIGISFWVRDLYDSALSHYLASLRIYEKLNFNRGIASINLNIGTIYDDIGQGERGKSYQQKSLNAFRTLNDTVNLGRALNNLAVLYANIGLRDSAIFYLGECIEIRLAQNDSVGVARVYNNAADIYLNHSETKDLRNENIKNAHYYLQQGLSYLREGQDENLEATLYANLGHVLLELNQLDLAYKTITKALTLAKKVDSKIRQQNSHHHLHEFYMATDNHEKALHHYKEYVRLDQEQRSVEINAKIDQLNIKYETEQKERQLAVLAKEQERERGLRNNIITAAIAIIAIVSIVLINVFLRRKKDMQIADLKMQHLNSEIDKKNKEISSYTLSFIQKNQIMEKLKEQINELKKQSDVSTNKQLTKINKMVDDTFRADEEWESFQLTFEQMHDGFFISLKEEFPSLGNAELKLCALLRLNMNLKESAKFLGIAADSVKTARYRLRKKLSLKTEENLTDFLIRFEKEAAGASV